jgi:solute carrier family 35 protein C2
VAPSALTFALDIGCSNYALVYLTVTFYTMCKSSAPLFLLGCAPLPHLPHPSCELASWRALCVHAHKVALNS